jgi:ribosomal protein L32E
MVEKFQRTKYRAYIKLGSRQRKLRRYKRPTGRHNKSRQKWKNHPVMVEVGYKNKKSDRNKIDNNVPILIYSLNDLNKIKSGNVAIIGKIGLKNKIEIAKEILKRKIKTLNLNPEKILRKLNKKSDKNELK